MASSSKSKKIYDVFLSFRGADSRNNFVSHLYQALHQVGIYTFRDSEELKKGDEISMLMKAIEESRIAIIIFSKNYASSRWCLKEVAKIMECKEQNNLIVLPVFYKVEPTEVRGGRALIEHESKFRKDLEEVKSWKQILSNAGSLSGWHLNDEDESKLIQTIVKTISTRLNRTPLDIAKHPIGIDSQVVKLKSMLDLESNGDDVVKVGLWGQGGRGKSTLARALYNAIFKQFEGSCFLANVRGARDSRDLVLLQEKLLSEILSPQQKLEVSSVERGINLIQDRLRHKKVLIILDDVDDLCQLNALAREGKWFGNGSRIIVTTRDSHLLTCLEIDKDHVYKVRELDHNEARQLLCEHAFLTHKKLKIKKSLVDGVLNHAKGLPLALVVLGSFLLDRREDEWKSTLKKLSRVPNYEIIDVLRISYDGLDEYEQKIFLHIACFFKGWDNEYIKKVLDSCDFEATIGLPVLFEKSLISIEWGKLQMHDLIQLMGMDIVRQECRHNPGRRSRLWLSNDFVDVLSCDMGDCAVEAIVLKLPKPTEMCIGPDAFTKMRTLRLLILHNVHNSFQGHICLPNELRWFEWPGYADRILKFSSGPKRLVGLNMNQSNVIIEPKQFKDFQNLKYIDFSHCEMMVRTPDLSCTPQLEELDLSNCKNLVEVHESIANLKKLQVLNLRKCYELSVFPNVLKSKYLRALNFCECIKFKRFPDIPHKLKELKELRLVETAIKELPTSIENLVALESMSISHCKNLEHLPYSIYKLQKLTVLNVQDCTNLIGFPKYKDSVDSCVKVGLSKLEVLELSRCNLSEVEFLENLSYFPLLSSLNLNYNNITTLPTSINKRDHLSILSVENCHRLREIPELPPLFDWLMAKNCNSLQKNEDLTSIDRIVRRCSVNDPLGE
ncbi:hypothetical protein EUGRSUZ_E02286, partial [Eucalyptus grandis]